MKNLAKIDKFYFVLTSVLIVLSIVFIFAFRGIFTAFVSAYEINNQVQQNNKIDLIKLEKAKELLFERDGSNFIEADDNRPIPTPSAVPTKIPALTVTPSVIDVVQ